MEFTLGLMLWQNRGFSTKVPQSSEAIEAILQAPGPRGELKLRYFLVGER
jgi:hypothetical protein